MSKDEFYYDYASRQLERQDALNSDYQDRAYRIITIAVTLLGAAALTLNLGRGVDLYSLLLVGLLVGLGLAFVLAMCLSVQILRPDDWKTGVEPAEMRKYISTHALGGLREWAADHVLDSLPANDKLLEVRARKLGKALWALATEGICLVGVGMYVAVTNFSSVSQPVAG